MHIWEMMALCPTPGGRVQHEDIGQGAPHWAVVEVASWHVLSLVGCNLVSIVFLKVCALSTNQRGLITLDPTVAPDKGFTF